MALDKETLLRDLNRSQGMSDHLNLVRVLRIVQQKRWLIATITCVSISISLAYAFHLPNFYTGTVKIVVEGMVDKPTQFDEVMMPEADGGNIYLQTQVSLIKGRKLLETAAEELNLAGHYGKFYGKVYTNRQAAKILVSNLRVQVTRGTQIVEVQVEDRAPEMAANIANAIARSYVRESLRDRLFISDQILKWFPEEGKALEGSSLMGQLRRLDDREITASLPSVTQNPVINQIKQEIVNLDAERRELSKRYTEEHPRMKELKARAEYLDQEMTVQTERILTGLKANLAGAFNITNVRIVEDAVVPKSPSGPPRLLIVLITSILGFSVSVLLAIFLANLDHTVKSEDEIQKIDLPFLGYVPLIQRLDLEARRKRQSAGELLENIAGDKALIDEVANVRSAVIFSMPAERSKVLLCTSSLPEEGKTTVASLLAMSMVRMGEKVLLIDADMRKPSLHKRFGLRNNYGLSNCLAGTQAPEDVWVQMDELRGLHIITAGERTPNPAMLLNSKALWEFLERMKPQYDRIILDVPPALHIPDALILSQAVDGVILVFSSGMVHVNVAKKLRDKFRLSGTPIVGTIVNRAVYKNLDNYYDYSYYRYYNRYQKYYKKHEEVEAEETLQHS